MKTSGGLEPGIYGAGHADRDIARVCLASRDVDASPGHPDTAADDA